MKWIKQSISLVAFSIPVFLQLATIPTIATQAQAQVNSASLTQQPTQSLLISQAFKPPQRGSAPPSAGGATRGSYCVQQNQLLTTLLPKENIGLTFSERPSFFWHVPKDTVKTAQFSILVEGDENSIEDDVVYETTLNVPTQPGIMKFTLPENSPPLKVGKRYHWYLTLVCDRQNPPRNPSLEGWVERIQPEPKLSKALEQADLRKRPALYADAGIWHEAITSLVALRCAEPNNFKVTADWRKFFQSVNLSQFASEPILDCCNSKQ